MPPAQSYQILKYYTPRDTWDPGFEVLDKSGNDCPDWYDYWLGAQRRAAIICRGTVGVPIKIFIMERVASWLLASDPGFKVSVRDPCVARSQIYKLPVAIVCDALKIAYATQGRGQYRDVFLWVRNLRKLLNLQVRVGNSLGLRRIRPCLRTLRAYWVSDAR